MHSTGYHPQDISPNILCVISCVLHNISCGLQFISCGFLMSTGYTMNSTGYHPQDIPPNILCVISCVLHNISCGLQFISCGFLMSTGYKMHSTGYHPQDIPPCPLRNKGYILYIYPVHDIIYPVENITCGVVHRIFKCYTQDICTLQDIYILYITLSNLPTG